MIFQCKRENILDQRYNIAFLAVFFSVPTCFFLGKEFYDVFTCYIILAIVFDQISKLFKPASLDKQKFLDSDKMMTEQIESYVRSKRVYRLKAIGISFFIGLITKVWTHEFSAYFIAIYFITWCFYPLYRIFYLKIPALKLSTIFNLKKVSGGYCKNPFNSLHDEHNPASSAWHHAQCNRVHQMMNSINSHSRILH